MAVGGANNNELSFKLTNASAAITKDQSILITYSDDDGDNAGSTLQDIAGNDVSSFVKELVTTAAPEAPDSSAPSLTTSSTSIDGQVITLTFDEPINTANPPSKDAFSISVNGESLGASGSASIDSITASDNTLTLNLFGGSKLYQGQTVVLDYDPAGQTGIQDQAASPNTATAFTQVISNNSTAQLPDFTPPTVSNTATDPSGTALTLNFSEKLAPISDTSSLKGELNAHGRQD